MLLTKVFLHPVCFSLFCLPNPQQGFLNFYFLFLWFFPPFKKLLVLLSGETGNTTLGHLKDHLLCRANLSLLDHFILSFPKMLQGGFCIFLVQSKVKLSCWSGRNVAGVNQGFPNGFSTCKVVIFSHFLPSNETRGGDCGGSEGHQRSVFATEQNICADNLTQANTNPSFPFGTIYHTCQWIHHSHINSDSAERF